MRRAWILVGGLASAALAAGAQAGDLANGKNVYTTNCQSCHGATGKGDGPVGAALNPRPRDFSAGDFKFDTDGDGKPGTDADLQNLIKNGASKYGGSALMAPWGHLPEKDIADVIAYVRSLKE